MVLRHIKNRVSSWFDLALHDLVGKAASVFYHAALKQFQITQFFLLL